MTDGAVVFESSDGIALITLNRPEAMNAMNRELSAGLREALQRVEDDRDIRVGIITGNGRAFCAGADLKERARSGDGGGSAGSTVEAFIHARRESGFYTRHAIKPMIAAVNGHCLAGGMELALTCEIRVASTEASFGLPEIKRGFFPGAGGPQRLPRMIPHAIAMEMILTGEPIDAETALRAGLVSRVVEPGELLPTARAIAGAVASNAELAVHAVRELALTAPEMTLEQSLRFGSALRWIIGQTDDAREGPRAFTERREPEYRGE